jgi:hypothetical protein
VGIGTSMAFLLRLPLMLFELLLRRLFGGDDDGSTTRYAPAPSAAPDYVAETDAPPPVSFTGAPSSNGAPPPPTAEEAIDRRFAREAVDEEREESGNVPPPTPLRPIHDEHVDTEPEVVESFGEPDEVGATLTIAEPWPGYDADTAGAIVARLRGADGATKGVVALYEGANKGRKTILKAAS